MAKGAFGGEVRIRIGSVFVKIGGIDDLDTPGITQEMTNWTAHDSAGGFARRTPTGRKSVEPFTLTLFYDSADPTHVALETFVTEGQDAPVAVQVELTDGHEYEVDCYVSSFKITSAQTENLKASVTFEPDSEPEITVV